jgi:predicted glycosyltransferase
VLASIISKTHEVVVLSRYRREQLKLGENVKVLGPGFFGPHVLERAKLFIGMGGTMTQEAALLGVPTISLYPHMLKVEEVLVKKGLVMKARNQKELEKTIKNLLMTENIASKNKRRAEKLVKRLIDVVEFSVKEIIASVKQPV